MNSRPAQTTGEVQGQPGYHLKIVHENKCFSIAREMSQQLRVSTVLAKDPS